MHFWTYLVPRASVTKGPRTLGTIFLAYVIATCPLVASLRKESLRQPEVSLSPRLSFFQPSARSLLAQENKPYTLVRLTKVKACAPKRAGGLRLSAVS